MQINFAKFAPTAVVVTAVSFCGWPYVFPSDDGGKQALAMPEIAPAQLTPRISPPPARDPFHAVGDPVVKLAALRARRPASKTTKAAARAADAARGESDPFSGLALIATSILGDERLAVINGRIYAEGDSIANKDPAAPACGVVCILPDCVFLECQGRTESLGYARGRRAKKHRGGERLAAPPGLDAPPPSPQPTASYRRSKRPNPPSL